MKSAGVTVKAGCSPGEHDWAGTAWSVVRRIVRKRTADGSLLCGGREGWEEGEGERRGDIGSKRGWGGEGGLVDTMEVS